MPLSTPTARVVGTGTGTAPTAQLRAGNADCIGVRLVNKNGATPAHIIFSRGDGDTANSVCQQILNSAPVAAYLRSTVTGATTVPDGGGAMAIGSSTGIYQPAPPVTTTPRTETGGAPGTGVGG